MRANGSSVVGTEGRPARGAPALRRELQVAPDARDRLFRVGNEGPAGEELADLDVTAGCLHAQVVGELGRRAVAVVALIDQRAADVLLVEAARLFTLGEALL